MPARTAVAALFAAGLLAGCGSTVRHPAAATPTPVAAGPSTAASRPVVGRPPRRPPPPRRPMARPPVRPAAPTPSAVDRFVAGLVGVGSADQLIVVYTAGYGQTLATFQAFQRTSAGWQLVFGPWSSLIGRNGFAPPGAKREGDGRTPTGAYGFGFFFGVLPDPGVRFPYRQVTGPYLVWDDDPSSPDYNEWVDERTTDPGAAPEPMDQVPAYDYGAVIAYNTARVPGAGSAIFLHVSHDSPTAGCVSLPMGELLPVLRWLDPAAAPRIVMGALPAISSG